MTRFAAIGSLGAFDLISAIEFDPFWDESHAISAGRAALGGVGLWGAVALDDWMADPWLGYLFGTYGSVGDVQFYADVGLNIDPIVTWAIIRYGFETVWEQLAFCDMLFPISAGGPVLTSLNVYTKAPFSCMDIETWIHVDPHGFQFFSLWASDVDLGIGGLLIDRMELLFRPNAKIVQFDLGFQVGEMACITPYVSLSDDPTTHHIDGLSFDALEMICTIGDVTVIVSELLNRTLMVPFFYVIGDDARIHKLEAGVWGPWWWWCVTPIAASEAIGIEIDRTGCCDTRFSVGLYTFFDTTLPASSPFDWTETHLTFECEFSNGYTVFGHLGTHHSSGMFLQFGFEAVWGDPTVFVPDWMQICCP